MGRMRTRNEMLSLALLRESKWRAMRRLIESDTFDVAFANMSEEDQKVVATCVDEGNADKIRSMLRGTRAIEDMPTYQIRELARTNRIKNWSRSPRFLLVKELKKING